MLKLFISVFLVVFVLNVDSNDGNNNNYNNNDNNYNNNNYNNNNNNNKNKFEIATTLITENGSSYACPYSKDVVLRDGENITVEMTHIKRINYVLVTLPSKKERAIKIDEDNKTTKKFHITSKSDGKWSFSTLTKKNTQGAEDPRLQSRHYLNDTYFEFLCNYTVKVLKTKSPEDNPEEGDPNLKYYIIGGVLAIIIIIQTIAILYILNTRKIRRIEELAMSARSASDTARYSTTPGRKPSVKTKSDEDAGSIYETLDVIQTPANDVPLPPPIETLPRPPKKEQMPLLGNSSNSTPMTPRKPQVPEEERIKNRPPMPLPGSDAQNATSPAFLSPNVGFAAHPKTESNMPMRGAAKPKPPVFTPAQIPPSPKRAAPKMPRKPSAVNQDPITNELNNILKKRQTGNIPPKPQKPLEVPEPISETKPRPPFPTPQGLKPPTMSKPTTPITPAKQLLRPVAPKNIPGLPRSPTQQPVPSPKPTPARKWPPVNSTPPHPTPPNLNPTPPHPIHGHPMQRSAHPIPGVQKPSHALPPRPTVPVLPENEYEEEPEYAEYDEFAENAEDDDEWTYEPLPQYNIYSS